MSSIQINSETVHRHLVGLMQGAHDGHAVSIAELQRQLSKHKHPKEMLKYLAAKELKRTKERQETIRAARAAARERNQTNKFAPTHPIFKKSRASKGARKTDAFDYRVILCGGFETNRRRH
jgi:hypothetical protein